MSRRSSDPPRITVPAQLIHDMRTPLSHVIGYTEMVMEQAQEAGHEDYLPYLEKVLAAGQLLLELVSTRFDAQPGHYPALGPDQPGEA